MQLFSFFEGSLAPPKTIKKPQKMLKPLDYTVISRFKGVIKNPQNRQKPLESTVILVS